MRLSRLLVLTALLCIAVGGAFANWPYHVLRLFSVDPLSRLSRVDPDRAPRMAFWTLFAFTRLLWSDAARGGRDRALPAPPGAQRPIVTALFLFTLVLGTMTFIEQLSVFHMVSRAGWFLPGTFGCLAVAWGVLLFGRHGVVALTASTDEARLVAVLRAGAIGYVRKDADPELLLAAVRAAARGQSLIDPSVAGTVLQDLVGRRVPGQELTERELEVLRRLAQGGTNRRIGEALCISEETVKTHVGSILSKLHLTHRTQAILYALKRGLVSLDDLDV